VVQELGLTNFQEMTDASREGEVPKRFGTSFFRGSTCNFNPYGKDHQSADFCTRFLLKGHLPAQKIIGPRTRVTAFGSCFAENITKHLSKLGFDVSRDRAPDIYISNMGEGLVNVHALLQQFEWALTDMAPPEGLWHGFDAKQFGYDDAVRRKTREVFLSTDVFIITFGLSEVWFDELTGGVFWRAVPMDRYDPNRHKFRVCTFAETMAAIGRIYRLIREQVPNAKAVFTVSPIPLIATFRDQSCITANTASKAIIRAALDEFMRVDLRSEERDVFYFPAFEIINELFPARFMEDGRHLHPHIVPAVMQIFEAYYCDSDLKPEEAERGLKLARILSAEQCGEDIRFK
jgi:hypothetical protein